MSDEKIKQPQQLDDRKKEVLSRLDIRAEYEALGVRVAAAKPTTNGWLACHSLYRQDANPSAGINVGSGPERGYYVDFGEAATRGSKPNLSKSFWDIALERGPHKDFKDAFRAYAGRTGVATGRAVEPPTERDVATFQRHLTAEVTRYLHEKRGLTDATIADRQIGWCPKRERNTLPVRNAAGGLLNIRFHNSKKKPKTLSWGSGYGNAQLYGADRLAKAAPGAIVCVTEGEFDSIVVEQETGFVAVTSTNGKNAFLPEWVAQFAGRHVALVWDCDAEGRGAVARLVLPMFEKAVKTGEVLSIRVVWLYETVADKAEKDATDWFTKSGGTGARLREMIEAAPIHLYAAGGGRPDAAAEVPEQLVSFADIDLEEHAGKLVMVPIQVFGESSEAYHCATSVEIVACPKRDGKGGCTGRSDWETGACNRPIPIALGDRVQLAFTAASDFQVMGALREYVCDQGCRASVRVNHDEAVSLREVWAHQVQDSGSDSELVEKPIYVAGGGPVSIGRYMATGWVQSHTRNQRPTMIVRELVPMNEDYQAFDLDDARDDLNTLRGLTPLNIANDLAAHVTRVYERDDLHLGVLLTLASPLWLDFPGDGRIRGWVSSIIIGDTGQAKTKVTMGICRHADVGHRVSGMTTSRTGLTYAIDYDDRRGYRIKAGAFLQASRQALVVDEAQDVPQEDLKTMAEGLDTGTLTIARVRGRTFESMTRTIFLCNPRHPWDAADQKSMDQFAAPAVSLLGIFPRMMIRRIDLAMFAAAFDIGDKQKIFFPAAEIGTPRVSGKVLRSLIHFAWTLEPDRIIISDEIGQAVRHEAFRLAQKFGGTADLPIVMDEDFRLAVARLSASYAVLSLASPDDLTTIVVTAEHVEAVGRFLDLIYSADNCRLDAYAAGYRERHGVADYDEFLESVRGWVEAAKAGDEPAGRKLLILAALRRVSWDGSAIKVSELADELDLDRKTLQRDMALLYKFHLTEQAKSGIRPTGKFNRFARLLEADMPGFLAERTQEEV